MPTNCKRRARHGNIVASMRGVITLDWIYTVFDHFWKAYIVILVMTAVIFKVAFARKLPILKAVVVYLVLAIGCYFFAIMHILRFPVIPALAITLVIIAVARLRMVISDRNPSE